MHKRSKKKTQTRFCELHDYNAKNCSKDSGQLQFFFIEHTWCKKILILGYVDYFNRKRNVVTDVVMTLHVMMCGHNIFMT